MRAIFTYTLPSLQKALVFGFLFFCVFGSGFGQPFTVSSGQGIASISSVSDCGSNYTFSFTTNTNWGKTVFIYDNSTAINGSWGTISGLGFSYLNWGAGEVGINNGTYNSTTIYVLITTSPKTITFSTTAPDCGPAGAEITISETSFSGFLYCSGSGPSTSQSFTVEGSNLTANITVTAPTNYEVSTNNSDFYASRTLTQSGGTVSSTPIYVRLKAGLSVGDYNAENISLTSTDAETKTVTLSGSVTGPLITVSETTRTGFTYCLDSGPSSEQSYTVSGSCLTGNITITPPANYQISTGTGGSFVATNPITLTQSGGNVAETTIYVRLQAGLSAGTYNSQNIVHASSGADSKNVTNSGTVTSSSITIASSNPSVAAANIEQATQKAPITAFAIAAASGDAQLSSVTFTTAGTYTTADVSNFKLWYHTSNSLASATQIGSTISASHGSGQTLTFSGLSQTIASGATRYFWITADIAPGATIGRTVSINAIANSNISFVCGSKSGSVNAGAAQTIIESTALIYYSRGTGNINTSSTWSLIGCGGTAVNSSDPDEWPMPANSHMVICNGNNVTANVDITTSGTVTVQSGGTLTVNNDRKLDSEIVVESGGAMTWPSNLYIGQNANILVNGNISASSTTIYYTDAYAGVNAAKIEATGTVSFSRVRSSGTGVKGGSIKGSSITVTNYGNNEDGVDVAFDGPTTISTYMGYGYTYFQNGDLTITTYNSNNSSSTPLNEIISDDPDSDLIFTNKVTAKNSSLQINIAGDVYFNSGFESAYTGSPSTRIIAENVYVSNELKAEGNTTLYIEANVIQQNNIAINQNSNGNIYIMKDFLSGNNQTNFNNTNAVFKVEGNARFENITGHLNSSAAIVVLGDAYMGGTGTFGANDGPIYVGGYLTLHTVQVSFQGSAYGYIGATRTAADFESAQVYTPANYDATTTIGGSGYHIRNESNNPDLNEGRYLSIAGGQFTNASMIQDIADAPSWLPIEPENWESLPIRLSAFYAMVVEYNYVELFWTTESEENNNYFTIYRSNNGVDFEPIAEVVGAGNSSMPISYSYYDASFYPGISYYTLAQTDFDGTKTYSHIIAVYRVAETVTYTFMGDVVEVTFDTPANRHHIMITSADGSILFSKGFTNIESTIIELPQNRGVYIISTLTPKSIVNEKFIR